MTEWILSSSLLVLIIAALRKLLRGRVKPLLQYSLWGIVLLRLLVPFSFFESSFSAMNLLSTLRPVEIMQTVEELGAYDDFVLDADHPADNEAFENYPGSIEAYHYGDSDRSFPTTVLTDVTKAEFMQLEKAVPAKSIIRRAVDLSAK